MGVVLSFLLTFIAGGAYECGCVFWVHYSETGQKRPAVMWSMFNACMTIIGVEEFIHSPALKVAYVLGFGCGTYLAIRYKSKWIKRLDSTT